MILKVNLDLPGDGNYLRIARRIGRMLLEDLGVVREDIDDTEFVVGELTSNVIRHAKSVDGRFGVRLEYHADRVVVTVIDQGVGFSFREVQPVGTARADMDGGERIGGFGLDLARRLSDRLEFYRTDPEGTTVQAEKRLHFRSERAAEEAAQMDRAGGGRIAVTA